MPGGAIRLTLRMALYTLIQLIAAWGLYMAGYAGYRLLIGQVRRDISFGLQLHHGTYGLVCLAAMNAICLVACSKPRRVLSVTLGCMVVWALFWANIWLAMPLRSALVVTAGVVALGLPMFVRRTLHRVAMTCRVRWRTVRRLPISRR